MQAKGALALMERDQASALETLRRLKEAALHVEGMSAEDRAAIVEGPRGYAELRHTAEEPTLILGLLNKFDIVLWDRVVNRISSVSNQSPFPAIRIVNGGTGWRETGEDRRGLAPVSARTHAPCPPSRMSFRSCSGSWPVRRGARRRPRGARSI